MKTLLRVWTLTLDLVMLLMLLAAPVPAQQGTGEGLARRPGRQPFLHDAGALNGDLLNSRPAYARVRQGQPRR